MRFTVLYNLLGEQADSTSGETSTGTRNLYHLTDNINFKPDKKFHPENNTTLGGDWPEPGIFLTEDPEYWINGYGYRRPWIVEFSVPEGVGKKFGREVFVNSEHFPKIRINRVMALDGWAREYFGEYGWTERFFNTTFDTEETITDPEARRPFKGYIAKDARGSDPSWIKRYKSRVTKYRKNAERPALL